MLRKHAETDETAGQRAEHREPGDGRDPCRLADLGQGRTDQ